MEEKKPDSAMQRFEQAAKAMQNGKYVFQLYVSGITPKSLRAIENAKALFEEYLKGRYELQVIDVYQHPDLAREDQIVAAPTLIKKLPLPLRRFIGDLSDKEHILVRLNLISDKPEANLS